MGATGPQARTYDFFLVFSPGANMLEAELTSLGADAAARVLSVDLYYRAETDVALVRLRIDASMGSHSFLTQLRSAAAAAGASALEPSRLEDDDRARFYSEHLAQYPLHVGGFPTVADAARKLAADLGSSPTPIAPSGTPRVTVSWRAGDRWQLARARNLTREGFYVYSSAPPRAGELVTMALQAGDDKVTLRAAVVHVTPDDAAVTVGGPGFGGRFMIDRPEDRSVLERIVAAGRGEGLGMLRAAPSRREARYAVRWPVIVGEPPQATALDLSRHGVFVTGPDLVPRGRVQLSVTADDGGEPLRAKARVARVVATGDARAGVSAGLGLELMDFAPGDVDRYEALVWRVGERSRRRVLVAGSGARVAGVAERLGAAGYVVTGVATRVELDGLLAGTLLPDLVVMDSKLGPPPRAVRSWVLGSSDGDDGIVSVIDGALLSER